VNTLAVIHYPIYGGPHNRLALLGPILREHGVSTTVVLPDGPGSAPERMRAAGLEVVQMPLRRLRARLDPRFHLGFVRGLRTDIRALRQLIRDSEIDLLVIGGLVNPQGVFAARAEGAAVVWQIVDTRIPLLLRAAMMPAVDRLADAVMFGAEGLVGLHPGARHLRVPTAVSRPAVDTTRFVPSEDRRRTAREHFGVPHDAPLVGTLANVNPQKGIEHFVRAAGAVARARPDAWFLIIGERDANNPRYLARIDAEIGDAGLGERMLFAGARFDAETLLPALDVKLVTSVPNSEGTTTTAMEAMACGVPVVATRVGAVDEVVEDELTGLLVPPLDPASIARATLRLLENPDTRAAMARAGRTRVEERFGLARSVELQLEIYERALAHRTARGSK
jgi:glycosyltransferase involved in cell wall biosynthesis